VDIGEGGAKKKKKTTQMGKKKKTKVERADHMNLKTGKAILTEIETAKRITNQKSRGSDNPERAQKDNIRKKGEAHP